jgi:hypothetical protein
MSYSSEIAGILEQQLAKWVTLNRHQLAGHVANLDFWLDEVHHALGVIDGYGPRFERLKAAELKYASEHTTTEFLLRDPRHTERSPAPPRRVPHSELSEARRSLCDAAYHFLVRCFNEELIAESKLREACDRLGISIEARDLKARG